jgi:hypothetical protein
MGSCRVPDALTRQLLRGKVGGKKTVKPRFGLTFAQSVKVVGVTVAGTPVAVGLAVTVGVAVPVGVPPAVAVAVALGVPPAVGVGVGMVPSSRKMITGFPHQCSFASGRCEAVAVGLGDEEEPPKFRPVHEIKKEPVTINNRLSLKPRLK